MVNKMTPRLAKWALAIAVLACMALALRHPTSATGVPAGEILFPDAGAIFVAGLTLRQAEAKVKDALRAYVRGKGLATDIPVPPERDLFR